MGTSQRVNNAPRIIMRLALMCIIVLGVGLAASHESMTDSAAPQFEETALPTELLSGAATSDDATNTAGKVKVRVLRADGTWGDVWLTKQRKHTGHRYGDHKYKKAAIQLRGELRKAARDFRTAKDRYQGKKGPSRETKAKRAKRARAIRARKARERATKLRTKRAERKSKELTIKE